ncbi:MAG TPA: PAS domain-containing protein [Burkholderiaceae bacterium]|nr:PAS domain-containing protein [Burkholderiaceae bacterium]
MTQEPIRVLLIEDNPADARLIELMLAEATALSFQFSWVDNLTDGMERIRGGGIDVVLLDLGLPESTGLDTLERLREGARVPTLVVLSGLTDEGVAVQALRSGAQDYLVKGQVDSALLARAIRYAMGRSQADEALRQAHAELETRVVERTAELAEAVDALHAEINERKRAEEGFRALVEHTPDLVARYDGACRTTYANPALARELGVAARSLLGHKPTDRAGMPIDQVRHYEDKILEVLASGKDASVDVLLGQASIQFRLVAERDVQGKVASVLAIGRDVTELMDTQRQLTTLLENLPDMVTRFDKKGRCLYVNPAVARMFGMPAHGYTGKTMRALGLDPDGLMEEALRRAIEEVAPNIGEVPWVGSDGERFFEVRHVPEMDDRGRVVTVLAIARDVTERKRAERMVREFNFRREAAREEERKYIARELHDELGQILSALRLEVAGLRMRFAQDNPGIAERASNMLVLVDSVIRVQRDLVSSLRPAILDMGIGPALEWLVSEFVGHSGVQCELQMSETQLNLDADQTTMVFRIVQESLTNIARHAQARRVVVALAHGPDGYLLTVRDDGKGFDRAAVRDPKSLGLVGLHERAQMLGGRLDIRSSTDGVFIALTFPAAVVGDAARTAKS